MSLQDFDFSHSTFWIQIHGLPLKFMTKSNALKIGSFFKEVVSYEDTLRKSGLGMTFMRIQAEVEITKPLPHRFLPELGRKENLDPILL